jgi:hypothetical protein
VVNLGLNNYLGYDNNIASYLRLDRTNMETVFGESIEDYLSSINVDL